MGTYLLHWVSTSHTSTLWSLWPYVHFLSLCVCVVCVCISVDVDSEKEGAGTDSGISSIGEPVNKQVSEGGKGFNVPEIEFQEYKVQYWSKTHQNHQLNYFFMYFLHSPKLTQLNYFVSIHSYTCSLRSHNCRQ